LDSEVVLERIGSAEVRIDEVDAAAAEGEEAGCIEVEVLGGRLRREGVDGAGSSERVLVVIERPGRS